MTQDMRKRKDAVTENMVRGSLSAEAAEGRAQCPESKDPKYNSRPCDTGCMIHSMYIF